MRKKILIIIFISVFIILIFPKSVNAMFGDLNYRITNVSVVGSEITFKGWAYIHRTQNYVKNGLFANEGGQKILMQAYTYDNAGNVDVIESVVFNNKDNNNDYNFYCELFLLSGEGSENGKCDSGDYKNLNTTRCDNDGYNGTSKCLYEDMSFSITFDVSNWDSNDVYFRIGASNNDFVNKLNYAEYKWYNAVVIDGLGTFTKLEDIYVSKAAYSGNGNKKIVIEEDAITAKVEFIAAYGMVYTYPFNGNYAGFGGFREGNGFVGCDGNVFELTTDNYDNWQVQGNVNPQGIPGKRENMYFLKAVRTDNMVEYTLSSGAKGRSYFYCPGEGTTIKVYGSHVKLSGENEFRIIPYNEKKKCVVNLASSDELKCNNSQILNSTCDELTVTTDLGSAKVKIEQVGTISNVFTPDTKLYAGGGLSFGIMYHNLIKWNYISGQDIDENSELHRKITEQMNKKIKDYDGYVNSITISDLNLDVNDLIKTCKQSSENSDYYDKELTVTCLFTLPKDKKDEAGNVSYFYDNSDLDVNNKYYTPLDYNGDYNVKATISGLNRITESSAREDSKEESKPWTDTWEVTVSDCSVELYTLLNGKYKFIYRPIDLNNPFPNRNPGINWFVWYNTDGNREELEESYSDLQYTVNLDNKAVVDIKNYNSSHNYLTWDSESWNEFISGKDYVVRWGGN